MQLHVAGITQGFQGLRLSEPTQTPKGMIPLAPIHAGFVIPSSTRVPTSIRGISRCARVPVAVLTLNVFLRSRLVPLGAQVGCGSEIPDATSATIGWLFNFGIQ
jgi:hypothetical protein